MSYVIQNHDGSYMCYDTRHRISATTNIKKAEVFHDEAKAHNVLDNCYPKNQRSLWQVVDRQSAYRTRGESFSRMLGFDFADVEG